MTKDYMEIICNPSKLSAVFAAVSRSDLASEGNPGLCGLCRKRKQKQITRMCEGCDWSQQDRNQNEFHLNCQDGISALVALSAFAENLTDRFTPRLRKCHIISQGNAHNLLGGNSC